jgi:hypothetical protein
VIGGLAVLAWRPQVAWLGCAALPEACVAAVDPAALAFEERPGPGRRRVATTASSG